MKKISLCLICLLLFSAWPCFAQEGMGGGDDEGPAVEASPGSDWSGGGPGGVPGWLYDPGFVRKVGLTGEQQEKIKEIIRAEQFKMIDLVAEYKKAKIRMRDLAIEDPLPEKAISQQIEKVIEAHGALQRGMMTTRLKVMKLLTLPQRKAVIDYWMAHHRHGRGRGGGGGGRGMGMGR